MNCLQFINEPKSDGQRLFEALKRIKKHGMGPNPFPNMRPSEIMMLHSILHCIRKRDGHGFDWPSENAESGGGSEENEKPASTGVTVSELSEFTQMTPSAVSQTVKSLEKKGYAVRTFNPSDRRVVFISASEQGRKILWQSAEAYLDYLDKVTAALGKEDTDKLIELLEKLANILPDNKERTD